MAAALPGTTCRRRRHDDPGRDRRVLPTGTVVRGLERRLPGRPVTGAPRMGVASRTWARRCGWRRPMAVGEVLAPRAGSRRDLCRSACASWFGASRRARESSATRRLLRNRVFHDLASLNRETAHAHRDREDRQPRLWRRRRREPRRSLCRHWACPTCGLCRSGAGRARVDPRDGPSRRAHRGRVPLPPRAPRVDRQGGRRSCTRCQRWPEAAPPPSRNPGPTGRGRRQDRPPCPRLRCCAHATACSARPGP